MTPLDNSLLPFGDTAAFLTGFVFSLLILSFIIRDSWLVRAGQYLLVGVTLAYTAVLVWSNVLWPRLLAPLLNPPLFDSSGRPGAALWNLWLPLAGGLLLWAAGIEYLRAGRRRQSGLWPRYLAPFPLAVLVGVGLGTGIAGAVQGTLLPQWGRATDTGHLFQAAPALLLAGLLTLIITGGALLHLQPGTATGEDNRFPPPLRPFLMGWAWLGERALWLTAGVVFARLFASRITLLIARLDALFFAPQATDLWRWLLALWPGS